MGVKVNKGDLITAAKVFRGQGDYEKEYACLVNLYHGQHKAGVYDMIREYRAHLTALSKDALDGDEVSRYMGLLRKAYLLTAREHFDDYMIFLEWDRSPEKKFWLPRRRVLWVLCQDLEDLFYGRIRFLGVSLPPRTGKALAYDTPVLTRNGWKPHGDLVVGDEVIAPSGEFVKVLAVHPPCEMEYAVEFTNGETVICHGSHEWRVYNRHRLKGETLETRQMLSDYKNYIIPAKIEYFVIKSIKPVSGKVGNCITVEGGMYCVGRTLIPTHNSTLGIFFMSWVMGNRPDIASVMTGHSDKLTDGFYREILSIITDDHTYNWGEVFPNSAIVDNSAKNETIDLVRRKRFPTFTARSISGTLTGAVEVGVGGILYCDDLVEDLEEALNPDRLDAKYQAYLNQLKDRKKDGALELMVGTRWNVFDPLGRIEEQYRGNPDYRFRVIPAVNKRGESNFDYPYQLGFSTQYYRDMKESIEPSEWAAKYMGAPYIREGLLYPADSLRRFYRLPEGEADAVWAICDPAQGGGDDTFLPVCYQYGEDHYLVDCVCTDALPNVSDELCAEILCKHKVSQCQYEINAAGGRTADVVSDKVAKLGGPTSITKRHTQANKETKILANSTWVKDHVLFLDDKYIKKGSMYEKMMRNLTLYTLTGKNAHDDVPDGLAQYAQFIIGKRSNVATLSRRFF